MPATAMGDWVASRLFQPEFGYAQIVHAGGPDFLRTVVVTRLICRHEHVNRHAGDLQRPQTTTKIVVVTADARRRVAVSSRQRRILGAASRFRANFSRTISEMLTRECAAAFQPGKAF